MTTLDELRTYVSEKCKVFDIDIEIITSNIDFEDDCTEEFLDDVVKYATEHQASEKIKTDDDVVKYLDLHDPTTRESVKIARDNYYTIDEFHHVPYTMLARLHYSHKLREKNKHVARSVIQLIKEYKSA